MSIDWKKEPYKSCLAFTGGLKKEALEVMELTKQLAKIGFEEIEYPEQRLTKEI